MPVGALEVTAMLTQDPERRSGLGRGAAIQNRPRPAAAGLRLTDKAYRAIKREILECNLLPGAEVTRRELAARLAIGNVPLREALIMLSQEGLLQPVPRSGYRITPVTVQDVQDIFALRLLLEPAAARQAAGRIERELLTRLNELCKAGYEPGNRASESAFLRANREFHVAIADASGNIRLARVLGQLLEETERLFHLGLAVRDRTDGMMHEHQDLLAAIAAGDAEAAARSTIEQIESARKMVMDGILSAPWFRGALVPQW
jgi:DNA-binding GntR family transcriptional regulator